MKRISLAALALLLASCRTAPEPTPTKDYAALADAAVAKFTIADNDAFGFAPEGRFDPNQPILENRKEGNWTVYKLAGKKSGFDTVEMSVDESGTIVRLQFFSASRSALGRREAIDTAYRDLEAKFKAVQRIGDLDTAELTVYVASDAAEWKQHYIQYLQLMDEPTHLGAQNCWILQPHLSQIQATIRKQGTGASLVIDFQTKKYAAALKAKAGPPKPTPPEE
jgi:hypothetical protein